MVEGREKSSPDSHLTHRVAAKAPNDDLLRTWYRTRWLIEGGVVDSRPLITRTVRLEDVNDSMPLLADRKASKPVIRPDGRGPDELPPKVERIPDSNIKGVPVHR